MPPHPGGIERVAERQAQAYLAAGHTVTWVAAGAPRRGGRSVEEGSARIRLNAANGLESRFGMPYPMIGPRALHATADAVTRADLVHLHDCLYLPVLAADRAARRRRIPTIVTQHVALVAFGTAIDPLLPLAYRRVGRQVLRNARTIAFVSAHVRDWFWANVDPALGGTIIPNAVDTTVFAPTDPATRAGARNAFGLPATGPVIAFVGRLVPKKGLRLLADAVALLEGVHLLVVGDGPERTAAAGLGPRVTLQPDLPRELMPSVYFAADALGLVSRGEGMPLALIEALASGIPAVVSDDPGFDDLGGCFGVIRSRRTPQAVAAAITALLSDEGARAARGRAARAWALEHHAPEVFAERYLALAQAALGGTERRGPTAREEQD